VLELAMLGVLVVGLISAVVIYARKDARGGQRAKTAERSKKIAQVVAERPSPAKDKAELIARAKRRAKRRGR